MNEPNYELLPCPFCGAGETLVQPDSKNWTGMRWEILSYIVLHWCVKAPGETMDAHLKIKAKTEAGAIERWNRRVEIKEDENE